MTTNNGIVTDCALIHSSEENVHPNSKLTDVAVVYRIFRLLPRMGSSKQYLGKRNDLTAERAMDHEATN